MKKLLVLFFTCLTTAGLFAQCFKGKAIYSTGSEMKLSFSPPPSDSSSQKIKTKKPMMTAQEKALNEQIRKSMQKEYELLFNQTESIYKEIPKLKNEIEGKGVQVIGIGGGTEGGLYKDTRNRKYLENRDVFGKLFLVSDSLQQLDWMLEKESKTIGSYTCYKAIAYQETKKVKKIKEGTEEKEVVTTDSTKITAWYTPEIPINQGPAEYWGLPGFILEVSNGKLHMVCSKITLNPEEEIEIKKPAKGKKADRVTFKKIYNKKVMDMVKMYDEKRKKDKGK